MCLALAPVLGPRLLPINYLTLPTLPYQVSNQPPIHLHHPTLTIYRLPPSSLPSLYSLHSIYILLYKPVSYSQPNPTAAINLFY